jgi:NUC153 domain
MPKQKVPKGVSAVATSQEAITDPRFASFATDPRFRLPSRKHARTKIDKRFSRMLKDDEFINTAKVDRYGRRLDHSEKKRALQRLYQPDDEDNEENEDQGLDIEVEDDEVVAKELSRENDKYDPARGGGFSSSEDESEDQEDDEVEVVDEPGFPDLHMEQAGVPMGEVTSRLAVVNLDWDNIRAVDLMAVFSSFVRSSGKIEKLSVYKSEFGKERMDREEIEGPPREIFAKKTENRGEKVDSEDEGEDEEELEEKIKKDLIKEDTGEEFDATALRQYQLERLRYYYAVAVCSDKETAQEIYESIDGTEYLSSANFIDLRFIPDDVDFDDKPRDECDSVPPGYKPTEFVTDALQHSKVKLTWDAEDTSRKDVIKRAFSGSRADIAENDLKAYIGSDSSEGEEEAVEGDGVDAPKLTKKELARQKMRAALGLPVEPTPQPSESKKAHVGDMEITFTAGLSSKEKGSVFENDPVKEESTAEAYIRKEKERKARRKEKARARREGRDPAIATDDKEHSKGQEPDLGFNDPFFATDEAAKEKAAKSARKEVRRQKREAKAAEDAAKASERVALELLMADNSTDAPSARLDHFDINEIARAEKLKKKLKRSRKGKADGDNEEGGRRGGMQEGFEMDVADPRFKAVFESHEFAIDPSNPKFKGTEGMKKLLEEGRKRKARDIESDAVSVSGKQRKKDSADQDTSLKGLVENLKKKAKR